MLRLVPLATAITIHAAESRLLETDTSMLAKRMAEGGPVSNREEGLAWQVGVWDRISQIYWSEIDRRFAPVVDHVLAWADLQAGERVLDLGTGTGAVAEKAAFAVEPGGHVLAIDISPEMLALAGRRADQASLKFQLEEGSGESIPAADASFDVILASLALMYVTTDLAPHARLLAS